MNYCPCGKPIESSPYSAFLLASFFRKLVNKYNFYLLCTDCGNKILGNYRDTYGIGV